MKSPLQGGLSEERDWDQWERKRSSAERGAGRKVKRPEFAGSEGHMALEFKNFLYQERTPHPTEKWGLCKNMCKEMKQCQLLICYQGICLPLQQYNRSPICNNPLEIFWPSCILDGGKSAGRVVSARILSSSVCCLNHGASEKKNQQLQELKYIF